MWEQRLAVLAEGLQNLNTIQRKWVYLEPIFSRGALPNEQPRFRRVAVYVSYLKASAAVLLVSAKTAAHLTCLLVQLGC